MDESFNLWKYTLSISDHIEQAVKNDQMSKDDLVRYLITIEEVFKGKNDPIENFEAYVFLQFCRAIRRAMENKNF